MKKKTIFLNGRVATISGGVLCESNATRGGMPCIFYILLTFSSKQKTNERKANINNMCVCVMLHLYRFMC